MVTPGGENHHLLKDVKSVPDDDDDIVSMLFSLSHAHNSSSSENGMPRLRDHCRAYDAQCLSATLSEKPPSES